jgi:hypothetical protein
MTTEKFRYGYHLLVALAFLACVGCEEEPDWRSIKNEEAKTLSPEPWMSQTPAKWPQFVLTNHADFKGHTSLEGASSFLIRSKDDRVFAATARHLIGSNGGVEPEVSVAEFNSALLSWRMFPRTLPKDFLEIESLGIDGLEREKCDWLVLKIKSARDKLPAQPLRFRHHPVEVGEKVYLIGCPYSEPEAKQNVYSGRVTARGFGDRFRYDLDPPVELPGFSGAPIIDEKGYVVGVMTVWFDPKMNGEDFLEAGGEDIATIFSRIEKGL